MFEQLNELKYNAENGKTYIVYFLEFWVATDGTDDYFVKYQIRGEDKDFFWFGRMSRERAIQDLKLSENTLKKMPDREIQEQVAHHFKHVFLHVLKRGLDKGFEESHTEFVFSVETPITKRRWRE
jgi:hypothetical protein